MSVIHALIESLLPHLHTLLIIGSIYPGEEAIMLFAVLAGQELISVWSVVIIGAIGILLVDHLIFWFGKSRHAINLNKWKLFRRSTQKLQKLMLRIHNEKPFLMLFLTKFIYGLRYMTVLYLSMKGMKWRKFFIYDVLAFALWAIIIIPLGWLAGHGFTIGLTIATRVEKVLGLAILIVVIFYLLEWVLRNSILKSR